MLVRIAGPPASTRVTVQSLGRLAGEFTPTFAARSQNSAGVVAEGLFALVADWGLRDGSIRCLWNLMDESGNQTVG